MAGSLAEFFFCVLMDRVDGSRSINMQKKNEANIKPFSTNKLGQ